MKTEKAKGFNDFTGEDAVKRAEIKRIISDCFEKYGFIPAETPIIEYEDFVKGNNEKDEAVSDIFKLKDKGKRNLALRYEFTFQLKRIAKNKKLPYKRYQIGELFRDEPTSQTRFKQFTQCDADILGSTIKDEAELLGMAKEVFDRLGIEFTVYFNNRKLLNEILEDFKIKNKEQVIREIDKLEKLPEKEILRNLKKYNAEKILKVFRKEESFFKKYKAYSEVEELKKYSKYYNVKIVFSPSLSRGLSYYNGNIFEIKSKKFRDTVCAGGSYKINEINSTGISFGLDRIAMISEVNLTANEILVVSLNKDKEAVSLAMKLRKNGNKCIVYYGKPSKALDYANSYKIGKVIFVGEKELKLKKFKIKDLSTGKEKLITEKKLL